MAQKTSAIGRRIDEDLSKGVAGHTLDAVVTGESLIEPAPVGVEKTVDGKILSKKFIEETPGLDIHGRQQFGFDLGKQIGRRKSLIERSYLQPLRGDCLLYTSPSP